MGVVYGIPSIEAPTGPSATAPAMGTGRAHADAHLLEKRVQTHIFLCVLAYHVLVTIDKHFLDQGVHTSWATLREQLSTHQVQTVVLPTSDGKELHIRKGSTPEPSHREIYRTLRIPSEVMTPVRTWVVPDP